MDRKVKMSFVSSVNEDSMGPSYSPSKDDQDVLFDDSEDHPDVLSEELAERPAGVNTTNLNYHND